jgi:DNA-binding Lrp family transcriptional regulator
MSAPEKLADIERKLLQKLQENKNGLSTKDIADQTQSLTPEERVTLINRLTSTGDVELLSIDGTNNTVLRYRKSTLAPGATAEEQLVGLIKKDRLESIFIGLFVD